MQHWLPRLILGIFVPSSFIGTSGISLSPTSDTCASKECINSAATILNNMNPSLDPCDDFFKFACGGFTEETMIPDDKPAYTMFDVLQDKLNKKLKRLFEEPVTDGEPKSFKNVKVFYKSCMNKEKIQKESSLYLVQLLTSLGGWPVLLGDKWNSDNFKWTDTVYRFRQKGVPDSVILTCTTLLDMKNASRRHLVFDQPVTTLKRELLVKNDSAVLQSYKKFQVELATILGADYNLATIEMEQVFNFEKKIAQISMGADERRNYSALYNLFTIRQLEEKWKNVPWLEYTKNMLPPNITVDETEEVSVLNPLYFEKFESLIAETPKRVLANYVMWRAAVSSVNYLNDSIQELHMKFKTVAYGSTERTPRWEECLATTRALHTAVGAMYVRRYFHKDSKQGVLEITEDIRRTFLEELDSLDWMDEATRYEAKEKAKQTIAYMGYPDELLDDKALDEYYHNLEVSEESFLEAHLNVSKFNIDTAFYELRMPVNKTFWVDHSDVAKVNAWNHIVYNLVMFPAGILHGSFYALERPRYLNYGGIGWVIGHELLHAFDDRGSQFDRNGTMHNWWGDSTKESYKNKTECVVEQFGGYSLGGNVTLNGKLTQGEAVADISGAKQAYRAYQDWLNKNSPEPLLPGLQNFTQNQLFWLGAANIYCSKYRHEVLKTLMPTIEHPPGEFRVIGSFSNLQEFSKDFNCPAGSKMNPAKKCVVW